MTGLAEMAPPSTSLPSQTLMGPLPILFRTPTLFRTSIGQPPIPLPIPSRTVMPFGTPEPPQFDEINKKEDIAREEVELLVANREHTVLMQNDAKWDPF